MMDDHEQGIGENIDKITNEERTLIADSYISESILRSTNYPYAKSEVNSLIKRFPDDLRIVIEHLVFRRISVRDTSLLLDISEASARQLAIRGLSEIRNLLESIRTRADEAASLIFPGASDDDPESLCLTLEEFVGDMRRTRRLLKLWRLSATP